MENETILLKNGEAIISGNVMYIKENGKTRIVIGPLNILKEKIKMKLNKQIVKTALALLVTIPTVAQAQQSCEEVQASYFRSLQLLSDEILVGQTEKVASINLLLNYVQKQRKENIALKRKLRAIRARNK